MKSLLIFVVFILFINSAAAIRHPRARFQPNKPANESNSRYAAYRDSTLSPRSRAQDLLKLLNVTEKLSMFLINWSENKRLGLPVFDWGQECLHGVVNRVDDPPYTVDGAATAFPQSIGLAASFNETLMRSVGDVISIESRGLRNKHQLNGDANAWPSYLSCWSPVVNIVKDPRWGRVPETYGEDPYLTYRLTSRYVAGLHGDDESRLRVAPVPKHMTTYDGPEVGRYSFNAEVTEIDLNETFNSVYYHLLAEKPVKAQGFMISYSALNGVPMAANFDTMTKRFRMDHNFTGHFVSDCDAVANIFSDHSYTADMASAAAVSLLAGMDIDCGQAPTAGFSYLGEALERGLIEESDLDKSLLRMLTLQMKLGVYDVFGTHPYDHIPPSIVDSEEHRKIALDATLQSMVLLKNEGSVLPLSLYDPDERIAVIGPQANDTANYEQCFQGSAGSCLLHHTYHSYSSFLIQPFLGIRDYVNEHAPGVSVEYELGCDRYSSNNASLFNATKLASRSDVTIALVGLDPNAEEEDTDRSNLLLPGIQAELLRNLRRVSNRLIVVVIGGSPLSDPALDLADAVLLSFYPGQWSGRAIAEILFGDSSPSGRLPYTIYNDTKQLPDIGDYRMTDGPGRTYRFLDTVKYGAPRYYFGDGLSYGLVRYGVSNSSMSANNSIAHLSVRIVNEGERDVDEVVQVYAAYDNQFLGVTADPALSIPRRQLVAFEKIRLKAGSEKMQHFTVSLDQLNGATRLANTLISADLSVDQVSTVEQYDSAATYGYAMKVRRTPSSPAAPLRQSKQLPVWFSLGGVQPTPDRIHSRIVSVQQVRFNVTV